MYVYLPLRSECINLVPSPSEAERPLLIARGTAPAPVGLRSIESTRATEAAWGPMIVFNIFDRWVDCKRFGTGLEDLILVMSIKGDENEAIESGILMVT
jgi:hypothetical protein